ncbi:MAG: helix-turn-helix transcriptional regulator [Clostridia bacterium]|nr:helix-turn-helix transcriptional regulator [Clostridia bacterium]
MMEEYAGTCELMEQEIKEGSFHEKGDFPDHLMDRTTAGQRVMIARRQMGLSQEKLGERCGMSRAQVSRIECGKSNPRCGTVRKLECVLNVNLMEQFVLEELKGKTEA